LVVTHIRPTVVIVSFTIIAGLAAQSINSPTLNTVASGVIGALAGYLTNHLYSRMLTSKAVALVGSQPPVTLTTYFTARTDDAPFFGRTEERSALIKWLEFPGKPSLLMYGRGGLGKTRLAYWLHTYAADLGWEVRWFEDSSSLGQIPKILESITGRLLVILDYAESMADLPKELFSEFDAAQIARLRLLLLVRTPGAWWEETTTRYRGHPLLSAIEIQLPEHIDDAMSMTEVVELSLAYFREKLDVPETVSARLDEADLSLATSILEVHAAVLAAILDRPDGRSDIVVRDFNSALRSLLEHEERVWLRSADGRGLTQGMGGITQIEMRMLFAACTVAGPSEAQFDLTLKRALNRSADAKIKDWVFSTFPESSGSGRYLSLDKLAEALLAKVLDESAGAVEIIASCVGDEHVSHALDFLARTASESVASSRILAAVAARCEKFVDSLSEETLLELLSRQALRGEAYVQLRQRVTESLLMRDANLSPSEREFVLVHAANCAYLLQDTESALKMGNEIEDLCRKRFESEGTSVSKAGWASALGNLSNITISADAGLSREQALRAARLFGESYEEDPERWRHEYLMSLVRLARRDFAYVQDLVRVLPQLVVFSKESWDETERGARSLWEVGRVFRLYHLHTEAMNGFNLSAILARELISQWPQRTGRVDAFYGRLLADLGVELWLRGELTEAQEALQESFDWMCELALHSWYLRGETASIFWRLEAVKKERLSGIREGRICECQGEGEGS